MAVTAFEAAGPEPRAAIGVVVPFDMELDAELWRWVPAGVDLLVTRTPYNARRVTVEFAREIADPAAIAVGVRSVVAGRADVVAYACTAASFVGGREGEALVRDTMALAGAREPVTTSGALVEAMLALGVRRVSVATPYLPELAALLDRFFAESGVEVLADHSLGRDHEIWTVPYRETAALVRSVDRPDADAIVISCTNLPTYDVIAPLEAELGKPVITANQTTVWAALRRLGLRLAGPGQRLAGVGLWRPEVV